MKPLAVLQPLWRPTLLRRIVGALSLAFALVGAVLIALDFAQFKYDMDRRPGVQTMAESMAAVLADVSDAHDAGLFVRLQALALARLRREDGKLQGDVEFGLYGTDGRTAFATPGAASVDRRTHWIGEARSGPWRLMIAEPRVGDATVIGWLGSETLVYLLLAFPIVLVPLWIAARRGMQPLNALADAVSRRDAQDLSPLDFVPRHDELRPLALAFDDLVARLRAQLQRERAFVQDAAHELRTPMAVVSAQAHLLVHATDAREREQAGAALEQALQRAGHLSRQLLLLATLDEARPRDAHDVDLASLVETALAQLAPRALAQALDLSLEAPPALKARLDRAAFDSVLFNLVDNALRYVPPGGRITVTLAAHDGGVRLCVADDGPGIPADQREAVFERFWRGPGSGEVAGTGLGLAIVRRAAARLHGQVSLTDGLDGRGCAFTLTLPADVLTPAAAS